VSYVLGIDYSTHAIDVVYVDENGEKPTLWHRHHLTGPDAWERTRKIRYWSLAWPEDVLAVGLEQPRGHGAGHLYRVQGAILCKLPAKVLVQPWLPNEWRKLCGMKGNAGKAESVIESTRILGGGKEDWPVDAHEAHLIALATREAISTKAAA
jgi:hypothetical protein